MKEGLVKVEYTEEEIKDLATEIKKHYDYMFAYKRPISGVRNLARMLEMYPQTEEDRLLALKYAAYLKYEIKSSIENVIRGLGSDPQYFKYRYNDFVVEQVLSFLYDYDETISVDHQRIEKCISLAKSYVAYDYYANKAKEKAKTLSLTQTKQE